MIDFQNQFHTGMLVPDLRAAMDHYGAALGVTWAEPHCHEALPVWTPDRGLQRLRIEFTYSREGPQHLEIQNGPPGTIYDPALQTGFHVGVWVDDVAAEVEGLMAKGWRVVASGAPPGDGYGRFVYLLPPSGGLMVELVSRAIEPRFKKWWAGTRLADIPV